LRGEIVFNESIGMIAIQQKTEIGIFSSYASPNRLNSSMVASSAEVAERVRDLIHTYHMIMFSKLYCPFSAKAKKLFSKVLNVPYYMFDLNHGSQNPAIQDCLGQLTGQKTIPSVLVNGQHIGNYDITLAAYRQGLLQPLLWTAIATMTLVKSDTAEALPLSPATLALDTLREIAVQREMITSVTLHSVTTLTIQKALLVYDYDLVVIDIGSG
jgi:glutaredoxin 3